MNEEFSNEGRGSMFAFVVVLFVCAYHCRMFLCKQLLIRTSEMTLIEKAKDRLN